MLVNTCKNRDQYLHHIKCFYVLDCVRIIEQCSIRYIHYLSPFYSACFLLCLLFTLLTFYSICFLRLNFYPSRYPPCRFATKILSKPYFPCRFATKFLAKQYFSCRFATEFCERQEITKPTGRRYTLMYPTVQADLRDLAVFHKITKQN